MKLSVVVPFFNIERDFGACLESLRLQTLTDAEFVLVDDGSRDSSAAIAADFAACDPRFRILTLAENEGAGAARNDGAAVALGEYLAFFDCDDVVHPQFYERAVAMLDRSGSDLLVAGAERFDTFGLYPSVLHAQAITDTRIGTHITRMPELGLDRMVWNKVIRRSFWDEAGLRFRTIMYEDYPFCLETHLAARTVDVLNETSVYWRRREGGEQSVTQQTANPAQLTGRFESDLIALGLAAGLPDALPVIRKHLVEIDVTAFAEAIANLDDDDAERALDQARTLLDRLGPEVLSTTTPFHRLQAELLRAGYRPGLRALAEHSRRYGKRGRIRRDGRGLVEDFAAGALAVRSGPPTLIANLDVARWDGDSMEVVLAVESTAALTAGTPVRVLLEPTAGDADPFELPFRATPAPGRFAADDGLSLSLTLDPAVDVDRLGRTFWRFVVVVQQLGLELRSTVGVVSRSRGRVPEPRPVPGPPGTVVQFGHQPDLGYGLTVQRPVVSVSGLDVEGDRLRLHGRIRPAAIEEQDDVRLRVEGPGIDLDLPVDLQRTPAGVTFSAVLDPGDLVGHPEHWNPVPAQTMFRVRLEVGDTPRTLWIDAGLPVATVVRGEQSVRALRGPTGALVVVAGRTDPEVTEVTWTAPGRLRFAGVWRGERPLPAEVLLVHAEQAPGEVARRTPLHADGTGYWFEVEVGALLTTGPVIPNPEPWHLVVPFPGRPSVQNHDRYRTHAFAEPRLVNGRPVDLRIAGGDVVRLAIS